MFQGIKQHSMQFMAFNQSAAPKWNYQIRVCTEGTPFACDDLWEFLGVSKSFDKLCTDISWVEKPASAVRLRHLDRSLDQLAAYLPQSGNALILAQLYFLGGGLHFCSIFLSQDVRLFSCHYPAVEGAVSLKLMGSGLTPKFSVDWRYKNALKIITNSIQNRQHAALKTS